MSGLYRYRQPFRSKSARLALLALYWNTNQETQYGMAIDIKKRRENEEKEWENPADPANVSDDRDKEQLLRQYKEAKRRKDNLTTEEDKTDNTTK